MCGHSYSYKLIHILTSFTALLFLPIVAFLEKRMLLLFFALCQAKNVPRMEILVQNRAVQRYQKSLDLTFIIRHYHSAEDEVHFNMKLQIERLFTLGARCL